MNVQISLSGKLTKPYKGICCVQCWTAQHKRCTCKCNGVFHGAGNRKQKDIFSEATSEFKSVHYDFPDSLDEEEK